MADVVARFKLEDGSELPIDKSFISSLKSVSESTSDAGSIVYGTLANTGSLQIQDGDGRISKLIDDGLLPISDLDLKIEVNDKIFQQHITADSNYNTEDNTLDVSLSNFIKDFDILKYKGYPYPDESRSLYNLFYDVLYSYFYPQRPYENYPLFIDNFFESKVLDYIKSITIQYPVIQYGKTYRQVLDELCTIGQLNMFSTRENLPSFISLRPIFTPKNSVKDLSWGNIVNDLTYTKTVKNKFDGVEISEYEVNDSMKYSQFVTKAEVNNIWENHFEHLISIPKTSPDELISGNFKFAKNSSGTEVAYIKCERAYISGTTYIPALSDMNLTQTKEISTSLFTNNDQNSPRYSIVYKHETTSCNCTKAGTTLDEFEHSLDYDMNFNSAIASGNFDNNPRYEALVNIIWNHVLTVDVSLKDESKLTVTYEPDNERFKVDYYILARQTAIKMSTPNANEVQFHIPMSGSLTIDTAESITISLYGNQRQISFKEISASSSNIENAKTKASVSSNNLLQTTTKYREEKISDIIKNNILNDYAVGVSDGELSLNKDIVEIGDYIKYPNSNKIWRVVGKELNYDGEYLLPLSVMECIQQYGLYDTDGELVYGWKDLIDKGLITVNDDALSNVDTSLSGIFMIKSDIKTIDDECFSGCSKLTNIIIPDSVTTIKSSAFFNCSSLTEIIIPQEAQFIGIRCFGNCTSLSKVVLPLKYTLIPQSTFMGCTSLKTINIPNNITTIDQYAFLDSGLEEIYISDSIKTIYPFAFEGCNNLKSAVFESSNWGVNSSGAWVTTTIDVSNPATNATNLTSTYLKYYWARVLIFPDS